MRTRAATVIAAVVLGAAVVPGTAASAAPAGGRQQDFADASASAGVPQDVLLAVSYLESRWDTNRGLPSTSAGFGPMHLTDAAAVAPARSAATEDARGDDARAARISGPAAAPPALAAASLQTLDRAAALTGVDKTVLRGDARANIRGGAALLASYQRDLGAPGGAGSDPAAWYGAVARYSGADTADAAAQFADEVYATMRAGVDRVTDDGQRVTLAARASVRPETSWLDRLGLRRTERPDGLECPAELPCEWIPAPYQDLGNGDYGNHDLSDRPARQRVQYIVIHDTEATYDTTLGLVQDPAYVSWNYTIRSADGHVAQHVKTKDVAWHAGNWYVNATSVGIEHEGFAAEGAWYTEAMYRSSAKLVRYLAGRLGIPLDRNHIIGHDNVPGTVPSTVRGMHWDPGPYWDWDHYLDLMHAPIRTTGSARTGLVTIDPAYDANRPAYTGCTAAGVACPDHGSSQLILHTAPSASSPLLVDVGLRPDGSASTMALSDHGSRVATGQTYAVAGREGDWTAIWYLGQKGWFYNPPSSPTAKWATGLVAVPRRDTVAVYGRAYPEQSAYPAGVPYQPITPLQYTFAAGQRYAVGNIVQGEYYRAVTFDGSSPGDWTVIRGNTWYAQIQFGYRMMYVNLADVQLLPSPVGAA
ncbi:peptidoglycan recognition family protein [Dactylosporangium sp. AC04546]|uniref:N-acetylmuramoyl-L-alanine amidase n=1 Tax=Dactylosporangium sp. AC04546 TaxID=2862460 RepID=UPI001EDF7A8F|nr:peptidoglycan recognition family protein [Dactylosporangium sp. AC04546]WVK80852.1 peptidoglycan recognition family protein [Dactylosporangium sp. AC04546]